MDYYEVEQILVDTFSNLLNQGASLEYLVSVLEKAVVNYRYFISKE